MTTPMPPPRPNPQFLEKLFPPIVVPAAEIDGIPLEVRDYMRDFGDLSWPQVPDKFYRLHNDAFHLMAPETLVHYVAGFMRLALLDERSGAEEFFMYFACSDEFAPFCSLLTSSQRAYILQFVDYFIEDDDYNNYRWHYEENRATISELP